MDSRRSALIRLARAACVVAPATSRAAQRRSPGDPFRLAVDEALAASGLAARLQQGFGRDTGVAVRLLPGPARELLAALERGEHDGAVLNTPQAETELDRLGLLRDRRQIAMADFLIVGPTMLRPRLEALQSATQAARALAALAQLGAPFVGSTGGSGTQELEAGLWRTAKVAPQPPWYRASSPGQTPWAAARAGLACALVERGVWAAADPAVRRATDFGVLVEGDPLLQVPIHALRPFRADHPAGRLFMDWLASAPGRKAVAGLTAYRVMPS